MIAAAALLAQPGFGSAQSAPSWSTFQESPQHNGVLNVSGPTTRTVANEWTLPSPVNAAAAVDGSGNAYVPDTDGNVYELSASNATAPIRTFAAGGPVYVSPALSADGSVLVVASNSGQVTEFKTSDGSKVWSVNIGGGATGPPVIASNGTVFVANGATVFALAGTDGSTVWKTSTPSGSVTAGLTLSLDGNTVYVPTSANQIVPLAASTGKTNGGGYYTAGKPDSAPAVDSTGTVYVTTGIGGGDIEAFSPSGTSSSPIWTFVTNATQPSRSTPAIANGLAVFGDDDQNVYGVSTTGHTATWVFKTAGPVSGSPAIATGNNMIYIGSQDGNVYALDTNGNQKWAYATGTPILASPALGNDHSLWIGSTSGVVYRFAAVQAPPPPSSTAPPSTTPTPTPTPPTTPTTTPTTLKLHVSGKVTPGKKETFTITTTPNTKVNIHVSFPNGDQIYRHVTSNASGVATYSFKVPASKITRTKHYAAVHIAVGAGATKKQITGKFGIKFAHIDVSAQPRSTKVGKTIQIYVHVGKNVKIQARLISANQHTVTLYGKCGRKGWAQMGFKVPSKLKGKGTTKVRVVARVNSRSPHYTTTTNFTIH